MINHYLQHILDFHGQFERKNIFLKNADKLKTALKPDGIVICGMGASGNTGKILRDLRNELKIPPVLVWNDYELPEHNFKNPLFLFISFSGKTAETLSAFNKLLNSSGEKPLMAGISQNKSPLQEVAEKHGIASASFDNGNLMPRESIGILFTAVRTVLEKVFDLEKQYLPPPISENMIKTGSDLAQILRDKIPLIYTDTKNTALGQIWKTNLNETAKIFSETSVLPEIFHNEIQIFEKSSEKYAVIWIYNEETLAKNQGKLNDIHKILEEKQIPTFAFPIVSKNREEQIWNSVVLANLVSYNIAILEGLDPFEISIIEELKK
jgi:bifunctional phosphoglucose/phosphomannose isomerase